MIACVKCQKPVRRITRQWGRQCAECIKAYRQAWYAKRKVSGLPVFGSKTWNPTKRKAYYTNPQVRKKTNARARLQQNVRRGTIMRKPCVECGSPKAQGHHLVEVLKDTAKYLDPREGEIVMETVELEAAVLDALRRIEGQT